MSNIGSELGNLGAAASAQAQHSHDAAMAVGAEHLRAASDARPPQRSPGRRIVPFVLLAVVAATIVALLVA